MAIRIYIYILLRFLIYFNSLVLIGYIDYNYILGDSQDSNTYNTQANENQDSEDEYSDNTPTNEKQNTNDGHVTPNETINDITEMKHNLKETKRILNGENVDQKTQNNIKEEFAYHFDKKKG